MKTYLPRIQVLRFIAAAMVLLGHVLDKVPAIPGLDLTHYTAIKSAAFLSGGVDIFFVLSGFIMYTISMDSFGKRGAPSQFFLRRLVRIVPSYWLFTTAMVFAVLVFGAHVSHGSLQAGHLIASYLFIPTTNAYGNMYPVLILGWTLNFEMFFYVVFACMLQFQRRHGLLLIGFVVGAAGLVGLVAPPNVSPLAFWCNPIVFEFLFGILLARARSTGFQLSRPVGWIVGLGGFMLLYWGVQHQSDPTPFWPNRFLFVGLPALVICASAALTRVSVSASYLQRQLVLAGDASYALYLSHPFTLAAVAIVWPKLGFDDPWLFVFSALALSIMISIVFYCVIEKPVTAWLNRLIMPAQAVSTKRAAQ
jgi:exopolysaccharide production protein ExoZ